VVAPLEVRPVSASGELEAFIRLPFALYRDEPRWVAPLLLERREFLDPRKNPVFEYARVQLFMAWRGTEPVGTIAAVANDRYCEYHPEDAHVGFFGLYECVRDPAVSDALVRAAADWLAGQGKTVMRGPVNLTTNDIVGLLVDGFDDDPAILMPWNPSWYEGQLAASGFVKCKDLYAYGIDARDYGGRFDKVTARLRERARFTIRPVDLGRWQEELASVRDCYNRAWAGNWGFVPWTDRELAFIAKELKPLVDTRLALVGEVDGKAVGFMITIPDANQALKLAHGRLLPFGLLKILWKLKVSKCTRLRTIIMGILPEHQHQGFDAFLVHQSIHNARAMGIPCSEMGWVLEDNLPMISALDKVGARRTKTYRVYDRPVRPVAP
jgi:GNAT superfamily N-acetyltransferase